MIVYHGTTVRRARRICQEGFLPKEPSRRVWFAEDRLYALGRAKTQARRTSDRAIVLTCDLDVKALRGRLGRGRVMHKNRVIAIDAPVPVSVLRWFPGVDAPASPEELANWVNAVLRLKPDRGAQPQHPGIVRLARWVEHRLASEPRGELRSSELLEMARRWLPELFLNIEVEPKHLRAHSRVGAVHIQVDASAAEADPRRDEAVELLSDPRAKRRIRGLSMLAKTKAPDLFDWCVMFLDDEAVAVRLAALEAMLGCDDAQPEVIEPLAASPNKRIRAAALAALATHGDAQAPRWCRRGLKDPCACVRIAVARHLARLDPVDHQDIFELALHDPNPDVARAARKVAAGQRYAAAT